MFGLIQQTVKDVGKTYRDLPEYIISYDEFKELCEETIEDEE